MDGIANILRGGNHYSEDDEKEDCVSVVQTVGDVVIVAHVNLGDAANSADQTVGHHWYRQVMKKKTTAM